MANAAALRCWPVTDVGRVRDSNEDSFLVDESLSLFVVADGMGGHAAGEVASGLAVHAFRDTLYEERALIEAYVRTRSPDARERLLRLMEHGVHNACSAVYAEAQRNPSRRGMGTTLVALLVAGHRGFFAHVGDSRIYLIRNDNVHQLTEDHSLINELLRRGRLKPEQIEKLNMKNAVTRAVGVHASVEVDTLDFDVLPGDRFLLCSDGLTEYVEEADILRVFREAPEDGVAQLFVDHANAAGGKDNITAVVVQLPTAGAEQGERASEVNLRLETLHRMPMFRHLTYQELVRLMNVIEVRSYGVGEAILQEGEEGDEMFIVLSGSVRVHANDEAIVELRAGQHFGEMALIDQAPRSATITSASECRLMVMRRRNFFDVIRKDHDVAVKLLWSFMGVLTERLRATSRDLGEAQSKLAILLGDTELSQDDLLEL